MPRKVPRKGKTSKAERSRPQVSLPTWPALLFISALVLLTVLRVCGPAIRHDDHLIRVGPMGSMRIHDFASHLTFAKAYWNGDGDYGVTGHLQMTSQWAGQVTPHALPFHYAPTMLAILGPLCPLSHTTAFVVWSILGGLTAGWTLFQVFCARPAGGVLDGKNIGWLLVATVILLGPLGATCLANGQTAIFATAGLLLLVQQSLAMSQSATDNGARQHTTRNQDVIASGVLWGLTATPPLAISGVVGLLACGRFRVLAIAGAMTAASTVLLGIGFPNGWMKEYLTLLLTYDLDAIDSAYAWSLQPEHTANIRGLLHASLAMADGVSRRIACGLWVGSLILILIAAWRKRIEPAFAWTWGVLAYLIFFPHGSHTERTLWVIPLYLITSQAIRIRVTEQWVAGLFIVALAIVPVTMPMLQWMAIGLQCGLIGIFWSASSVASRGMANG